MPKEKEAPVAAAAPEKKKKNATTEAVKVATEVEKASAERQRPTMTASELYHFEQQQAARRIAESRKKRDEEARARRWYAMFQWRNDALNEDGTTINVGDYAQQKKGPRHMKPLQWGLVCEAELLTLRENNKKGRIGLVVLPEGSKPSDLKVDATAGG